ncbi:polyprenyl-synt-domain-containing protein [Apiospora hydei]|uniref:Polyprenyl-synt-domain-containing protein n=1 Tax=Apiospora hydei TaxID=1337664 RepID=A0ABR1X7V4_9PEZI
MANTLAQFGEVFPILVENLKDICAEQDNLPDQVWQWFEKTLNYNVVGGKCNRGLSVVDTTRILLGRDLTSEEYFQSATLGWMIELLQAMFLVLDDIMDGSTTRRGQPCWYRQPDVGMMAVNDAPMLESAIYLLLKKHFRAHPAYLELVETFHEVAFQIEVGQTYDMLTERRQNLDEFDQARYGTIVTYKTAYYSFYLPVALALHYTGRATAGNLGQAKEVLVAMGQYFQVQDDYLDNFADPAVLGKIGTDIPEGKCSWLVVQALKLCTAEQHAALKANYGRAGECDAQVCERRIKELYVELGLDGIYHEYEERTVAELREKIANVDEREGLQKGVFTAFLDKIYGRKK